MPKLNHSSPPKFQPFTMKKAAAKIAAQNLTDSNTIAQLYDLVEEPLSPVLQSITKNNPDFKWEYDHVMEKTSLRLILYLAKSAKITIFNITNSKILFADNRKITLIDLTDVIGENVNLKLNTVQFGMFMILKKSNYIFFKHTPLPENTIKKFQHQHPDDFDKSITTGIKIFSAGSHLGSSDDTTLDEFISSIYSNFFPHPLYIPNEPTIELENFDNIVTTLVKNQHSEIISNENTWETLNRLQIFSQQKVECEVFDGKVIQFDGSDNKNQDGISCFITKKILAGDYNELDASLIYLFRLEEKINLKLFDPLDSIIINCIERIHGEFYLHLSGEYQGAKVIQLIPLKLSQSPFKRRLSKFLSLH